MTTKRAASAWVVSALLVGLAAATGVGPVLGGEQWGWLGVRIRDLTEREMEDLSIKLGLTEGYGVVIAEVIEATPAAASGLRTGDLVVAIGGRPVVETRALQRIVGGTPAGRELGLVVLREGERREVRVRVGQMPGEVVAERVAAEFGFLVRAAEPQDRPPGLMAGVPVVAAVAERSSAARGGLEAGDRVLAVNGQAVGTIAEFRRQVQEVFLREELKLRVRRKGEPVTVALPPVRPRPPAQ